MHGHFWPNLQYVIVDRLGVWVHPFIEQDLFDNNVPFDNTTLIYLINLPCKLGLALGLELKVALY